MKQQENVLPIINGWPYQQIEKGFEDYTWRFTARPSFLLVGWRLWALLMNASDAEQFYAVGAVPIQIDRLNILEPSEFMFTR